MSCQKEVYRNSDIKGETSDVSHIQIELSSLSRRGIIQIRRDPDCFEIQTENERWRDLPNTSVLINQATALILIIMDPDQSRPKSLGVNSVTLVTNNLRAEGTPSLQGVGRMKSTVQHCTSLEQVSLVSLLLYWISSSKKNRNFFLNLFLFKILETSSRKKRGLKLLLVSN